MKTSEVSTSKIPSFSCKNLEGWKTWVENNKDPYSRVGVVFAERWAMLMEQEMSQGVTLKSCAEGTCYAADINNEVSIFLYGIVVNILSQVWEYGEELRCWYNLTN